MRRRGLPGSPFAGSDIHGAWAQHKLHLGARDRGLGGPADKDFLDTFLLTFRAFLTPLELMDAIESSGRTPIIGEEAAVVQRSALQVLHAWVTKAYNDFNTEPLLMARLHHFLGACRGDEARDATIVIQAFLQDQAHVDEDHRRGDEALDGAALGEEESIKHMRSVAGVPAGVLAQQMTLHVARLFARVDAATFVRVGLDDHKDRHISGLSERANAEYAWVQREIAHSEDCFMQALLISKFIRVRKPPVRVLHAWTQRTRLTCLCVDCRVVPQTAQLLLSMVGGGRPGQHPQALRRVEARAAQGCCSARGTHCAYRPAQEL